MNPENEPKWKAMAERSTVLLADCGSKGFGLSLPTSDNDLKGVCVEDFSASMSLSGKFEQFIEKVPPTHQYAGHDLVIYSLEKFLRLAMAGNPDVTPLLFSKSPVKITPAGVELQALVPRMIHMGWAKRFLGYMESQRQKLIGERGQKRVTRTDLVAEHGHDCYSDDTEFLTKRGWLKYDDITSSEEIGTVNQKTGCLEFQYPTDRIAKKYDGLMYNFKHRYTDCLVTPNHRMWIHRKNLSNEFVQAEKAAKLRDFYTRVGICENKKEYPISDSVLRVVGAYVAEGHITKKLSNGSASVICISQNVGGRLEPIINQIKNEFPTKSFGPYPPHGISKGESMVYTIANRHLARSVVEWCGEGSETKHLPVWASSLSSRQANLLLDALMAGDGTLFKRTGYRIYYTISKMLAGDVQVLSLIAGFRSNVWGPYETGMYQVLVNDGDRDQFLTRIGNVKTVEDCKRIVCFTVPNEVLISRRNGRIAIHGNTKYAYHLLRLGMQGIELMTDGTITMPFTGAKRDHLLAVRGGQVSLNDVLQEAGDLDRELKDLMSENQWPEHPDVEYIEEWMRETYWSAWETNPSMWARNS